ncbi:MAG TPA: alpha-E domain-containing protein, partial [bacterium]|nr:alpha-E domain-containing protein [bacterium]
MLSRVGDAIYWMSRYIERAENVARFVDANIHMMLDLPQEDEQWLPLLSTTGDEALYTQRYRAATRENVERFVTFDRENPNSILSCLRAARENARSIREYITTEMWEHLNSFFLTVRDAATDGPMELPHAFYSGIMRASHQFIGATDATMSHGEGWHFGVLGRLLERADKTSRILDAKYFVLLPSVNYVGSVYDDIQWAAVLRSTSALQMYRQRFGQISPSRVIEFLLLSAEFPRSVRFCL